jgi:phosphonate transport system substrate-binding protein
MKMRLKKWSALLIAGLMTVSLAAGCSTGANKNETAASKEPKKAEVKELKLGLIPAEDNEEMIKKFKPTMEYLSKELGVEVKPFVATDYTAVVEAMRAGHIDAAFFGPFSYILAADKANAEAFAVGVREDGKSTYKSIIITHKNSGIKSLADLKGKKFSFVDPASTSGNLIPRALFKKNGIDPDKDFANVTYTGGHDAAELAIKNKKVDAAADNDITYGRMVAEGLIAKDENIILAESDPIPGSPIAIRKDLNPELKEKLKQAFLKMHEKAPQALGGYGKIIRYDAATDKEYDVIRDTAKLLNLDPAKVK